MKILVIGSGGREHALVWKIKQSPLVTEIHAAPGNTGIASLAKCVDITPENIDGLADYAETEEIDLTVVGPEIPLCKGVVDLFEKRNLRIFGPNRAAAELEGSKIFCKEILRRAGIPTPNFRVFQQAEPAFAYARSAKYPLVVKADGLAAGKGAVICHTEEEALSIIDRMMKQLVFGKAGEKIVIEEFLSGVESSVMALTDGKTIVELESVQDYKRIYDGDRGPNTGGMGAYSPAPVASERDSQRVIREILVPIVHTMNSERKRFKGLLYAGIMFTKSGPKVLEFNVRFGDPETQAILLRLKSDLVPLLNATIDEKLEEAAGSIEWEERAASCVVLTSGGYPGNYETGYEISGLDDLGDAVAFHSGTREQDGSCVTSGGRVVGIACLGKDLPDARERTYAAVEKVSFRGLHHRKDIGAGPRER